MKTVVYIMIALAIVFLIIRYYWEREPKERPEPPLKEGERTIDEIMDGRTFNEIFEELDNKEPEELTANESWVLYNITVYGEQQRMQADSSVKANEGDSFVQ